MWETQRLQKLTGIMCKKMFKYCMNLEKLQYITFSNLYHRSMMTARFDMLWSFGFVKNHFNVVSWSESFKTLTCIRCHVKITLLEEIIMTIFHALYIDHLNAKLYAPKVNYWILTDLINVCSFQMQLNHKVLSFFFQSSEITGDSRKEPLCVISSLV